MCKSGIVFLSQGSEFDSKNTKHCNQQEVYTYNIVLSDDYCSNEKSVMNGLAKSPVANYDFIHGHWEF
jgi:hypothetical protein